MVAVKVVDWPESSPLGERTGEPTEKAGLRVNDEVPDETERGGTPESVTETQ
jgi:hypothetical protein